MSFDGEGFGAGSTGAGGPPDPHAASHENGGSDEINVAGLSGVLADPQTPAAHATTHAETTGQTADDHHPQVHDLAGADHNAATLAELNAKVSDAPLDDSSATRPPSAHASDHENAGGDEISVAGLSGVLADAQTPASHAFAGAEHSASLLAAVNGKISDATLIDTGDSRLSDARTPTAHAVSHENGGSDEISAINVEIVG